MPILQMLPLLFKKGGILIMANVMKAPGKYIQAAGEIKNLGTHAKNMGHKFIVLLSKRNYGELGETIKASLAGARSFPPFTLLFVLFYFAFFCLTFLLLKKSKNTSYIPR